jgi:hypothetical protein
MEGIVHSLSSKTHPGTRRKAGRPPLSGSSENGVKRKYTKHQKVHPLKGRKSEWWSKLTKKQKAQVIEKRQSSMHARKLEKEKEAKAAA